MKKINELFGFKVLATPPIGIGYIAATSTTEGGARRKARQVLQKRNPHAHIVLKSIEIKFQKVESDATS